MTDKTLSYPKTETPYQSGWLIVTKALLINRLCLKTVLISLEKAPYCMPMECSIGMSLETLVSSLNPLLRLSSLTLTQACIGLNFQPAHHGRRSAIRHCQDCIDANYHSAIFLNPLIESCPVHNKVLTYCSCCTDALYKGGRLFSRPLPKKGICGHLKKLAEQRVPVVKLSGEEIRAFEKIGNGYQIWLDTIERLELGAVSDVIPKISSAADLKVSEFYFEYIRRYAGLPFDLHWQYAPLPYKICSIDYFPGPNLKHSQSKLLSATDFCERADYQGGREIFAVHVADIVKSLKSMRRYLFRAYIKRHRKCFNLIKGLSHDQLNILSFTSRCSCVSAYCAWLVSSGGVSTLPEHQGIRSTSPMVEIFSDLQSQNSVNLREVILSQLVSFFDLWGGIETANMSLEEYSDIIITRVAIPNKSFSCMNASYTLTRQDKAGGRVRKKKSYILAPDQLSAQSLERCSCNRQKHSSRFVQAGKRNLFVSSAHGIMRFVNGGCDFRSTLVISVW